MCILILHMGIDCHWYPTITITITTHIGIGIAHHDPAQVILRLHLNDPHFGQLLLLAHEQPIQLHDLVIDIVQFLSHPLLLRQQFPIPAPTVLILAPHSLHILNGLPADLLQLLAFSKEMLYLGQGTRVVLLG